MDPNNVIELTFLHPRDQSRTLIVDESLECSGEEALREVMSDPGAGAFIYPLPPGQAYELVIDRTQQSITPHMSFEQAGAINGDLINIRQTATGGGDSGRPELGHMLFWSAAAAPVFLKSAAPIIVEFLRSRSSRSITVQRGEDKIVIPGTDGDKAMELWTLLKNRPTDERGSKSVKQSDRLTQPITVTLNDSKRIDSTGDDSA